MEQIPLNPFQQDLETLISDSSDSMVCDPSSRLIPTGFRRSESSDYVLFVNAGGEAINEADGGLTVMGDSYFEGGNILRTNEQIEEAGDCPIIYQSARLGNFCYRFDNLPRGDYIVDLHFVEIINTNGPKGIRVFNVYIQEEKVLSELDIFSVVGANKPLRLIDSRVSVKDDGVILIRFESINGSPVVSGICIRRARKELVPQVTCDYIKCNYCAGHIEVPSSQLKSMQTKSTAKNEKKIEELTLQCQLKAKECHEAWMSLTATNEQLETVRMELDNVTFKTLSLDQTVEKQAETLRNISSSYDHDKKKWTEAIRTLQEKIKLMKSEHTQLSCEAHECVNSIPELNKMVFAVQELVKQCEDFKLKYNEEMAQRKRLFNKVQEAKENVTPRQLNNRVQSLRRSQRLLNAKHVSSQPDQTVKQCEDFKLKYNEEMTQRKRLFNEVQEAKEKVTPRQLNNHVQSLRRSQRLLHAKHVSSQPDQTINRAKFVEIINLDSNFVEEETYQVVSCKAEQMTKGVSMTRDKFKIEALVKGKRKRDENSEAAQNGWTNKQEVALQRAYFATKPTPHFWKKVSKLVPGKSAQDCFERIHQDHLTPPQHRPRSRAKKFKSSPVEEVLLSASKLLKPIVNEARKSSRSKSKTYLTQKSLRKLLQRNQKVGLAHEGDLFSVLEPNEDFPTNAFPPSDALSTPEKLDEKQGWLQSCTEKSSSRQGKALSRFNSSCDSDIVSPPVLKQVKNRVLHEKYINQLRCREARRRAASARVEMSKLGKAVSKESNVQKGGVVESAKIALVSEARDAIKMFQYSQANLMDSCNSDEDIDDHVEAESCDDEDESQ